MFVNQYVNVTSGGPTVQILIAYILKNIRYAVCYANPRDNTEEILLKIFDIVIYVEDRKTVMAGNFNIEFNSQKSLDFIEIMQTVDFSTTNPNVIYF